MREEWVGVGGVGVHESTLREMVFLTGGLVVCIVTGNDEQGELVPDEAVLTDVDDLDPVLASPSEITVQDLDPLAETLPTTAVKWENFERLLLRMAQKVLGLRNVKRYGKRGQAQDGIDVVGLDAEREAVAIQSKRYQSFTLADLKGLLHG